MSTNPGVTMRPSASIVSVAGSSMDSAIRTMRPSFTATSALRAGAPVPSTTVPFLMTMSSTVLTPC